MDTKCRQLWSNINRRTLWALSKPPRRARSLCAIIWRPCLNTTRGTIRCLPRIQPEPSTRRQHAHEARPSMCSQVTLRHRRPHYLSIGRACTCLALPPKSKQTANPRDRPETAMTVAAPLQAIEPSSFWSVGCPRLETLSRYKRTHHTTPLSICLGVGPGLPTDSYVSLMMQAIWIMGCRVTRI